MKLPLLDSDDETVPASGTVEIVLGPKYQGEVWEIDSVAVMMSTAVLEPKGEMFVNGRYIGGTYVASRNGSEQSIRLQSGDQLKFRWTGADVGATATFTVSGFKYLPG